jgi:protein ImuB
MSSADKSPTGVRRNGATPAQQSLALELPLAANDPLANSAAAGRSWLCIHLPALSLEALGTAHDSAVRAVFEDQDGIRKVLLADAAACAAGIRPGLSVNAALALLPSLVLEQRDTQCEQRTLLRLAGWAEQFTSFVVVEPPSTLLLELAGSLQLFGGLRVLRTKIARGLREQGFTAARAIAPTPLAATWLARAGHRVCIRAPANLVGALSRLPPLGPEVKAELLR